MMCRSGGMRGVWRICEHGPDSGPHRMPLDSWPMLHEYVLEPVSSGPVGSTGDSGVCSPVSMSDAGRRDVCMLLCSKECSGRS